MDAGIDRSRIRVLGLIGGYNGAVDAYRVKLPFSHLNNDGFRCSWMKSDEAAKHLQAGRYDLVFDYDIIVVSRRIAWSDDDAKMMEALAVRGAKLVYETDDDYTGEHRQFPEGTCHPFLPLAKAITVSTKYLGQVMGEASGGKPVYVLPNRIDREWFAGVAQQAPPRQTDKLTVMLAGTRSHYTDWLIMADVVPELTERYDVEFLVGGVTPDYLEGKVTSIGALPYTLYPQMLAWADVLLAPLDPDDGFNLSKSPIKAVEGWCAVRQVGKKAGGCAMVVSDHPVYRGAVNNRNNGVLVKEHTPEAWADALSLVIEDRFLRQKLQINGWKSAARYDINRGWKAWADAYRRIGGLT